MAEQARIEAQLHELEGMRDIQVGLELTHISEDEQMSVDKAPEPRPIEAKLRALEKFVRVEAFQLPPSPYFFFKILFIFSSLRHSSAYLALSFLYLTYCIYILMMMMILNCSFLLQGSAFRQEHGGKVPRLSLEEAVELERQAHAADLERKRRLLERREKQGLAVKGGGAFTREQQEARIWAFMCVDPLANLIATKDDSDVLCHLSGIINPQSLTSKMTTTTTQKMKTRQRGSMMIRMTGERVRTSLSPMLRTCRT